jgi:alcohol dehydrogenase class IV
MKFDINIPVRVISGRGCVRENAGKVAVGRRAFIVCGAHGAKKSGALDDVCAALNCAGSEYMIFDKSVENPPVAMCREGGRAAADYGADFVIGIGGGSSLDAAKAVAAFATNPLIEPLDIYDPAKRIKHSLPLVLIPTTAGTGSETNPYAVLTLPDGKRKKTFTCEDSWAKIAFVDPEYTMSMPRAGTISCALDAFSHGIESYLSPKSTDVSSMLAMYAMKKVWNVLTAYPEDFTYEMREDLMYASCAAGAAISITGTGFPHPLGYSLTLLDGVPHGAACAVFEGDYIEYNERTEAGLAGLEKIYEALDAKPGVMKEFLPALSGVDLKLTEEQISEHVELACGAKNYANSPYVISKDEMYDIYRKHFSSVRKRRKAQ